MFQQVCFKNYIYSEKMNLSIGHIEIFVRDTLQSRKFYTSILGFEHIETQDNKFVWLKLGESTVLLRPGTPPNIGKFYQTTNIGLVIYSNDASKTLENFINRGLEIKGDDTGCPVFTDPDGNWFQLVNPEEHSKRN